MYVCMYVCMDVFIYVFVRLRVRLFAPNIGMSEDIHVDTKGPTTSATHCYHEHSRTYTTTFHCSRSFLVRGLGASDNKDCGRSMKTNDSRKEQSFTE